MMPRHCHGSGMMPWRFDFGASTPDGNGSPLGPMSTSALA
jgi:hypothetical protein